MYVVVLDVGTSSMRGILADEHGRFLAVKQINYCPRYVTDRWIEQDAADFEKALTVIGKAMAEAAKEHHIQISCISVTSQRSAVIPVDRSGDPLMPAVMWQDTRNADIVKRLKTQDELVFSISGAGVNTVFSGSKMTWIRENCADVYGKLYKYMTIPSYLMFRMTGSYCMDYTYASRSNLLDLREKRWSAELLELFRVKEEHLCTLIEPGTSVGTITREFAKATGLTQGIPVVSAGGDQQCAAMGQGAFKEGLVSVVAGTGAFLVTACDSFPQNLKRDITCNCSAVPGKYILETNVLTCASAFDWFRKMFYRDPQDYALINQELAEACAENSDEIVLPFFQGRSFGGWNPDAKAYFGNITLSTTRKEMLKALLQGIFLEVHNGILAFEEYVPVKEAYISGGMTKSSVMNQLQADIYGIKLHRSKNSESTALGALMSALTAMGVCPDMDTAFMAVSPKDEDIYVPDREKTAQYEKTRVEVNRLYRKINSKEEKR